MTTYQVQLVDVRPLPFLPPISLSYDQPQISVPGLAYICLGGFVVVYSMMSLIAREKLYVNETIIGTAFGVLMGPHVLDAFNPRAWVNSTATLDRITLEITRITLVTGLFAIGVELPKSYMYDQARSLTAMVVPTMAIGWFIVSGLLKALFPRFTFLTCLVIASCLTPTDPIISAVIVGGKFAKRHVPENLRHLISAESAANDGLAFPFLTFSIYLTVQRSAKEGLKDWFLVGILYQVVMGTVIGALMGWLFSRFMKYANKLGWIDRQSYVAQYLALSVFIAGVVSTVGSDDLLAAFAAGCAISWDGDFKERTEGELFSILIDLILNCGCFIYIGAWLPFEHFNMPELGITPWRLTLLCIGILLLRRIPALLMLYKWIPQIRNWKEALFTGHFGPMGVGAVFVSTLALRMLPAPTYPPQTQEDLLALTLQPIVAFVVLGSIIVHGLSIPFFNLGQSVKSRTSTLTKSRTTRFSSPEWLNQITAGWGPAPKIESATGSAATGAGAGEDLDCRVVVDIENTTSTAAPHETTTTTAPVCDERREIAAVKTVAFDDDMVPANDAGNDDHPTQSQSPLVGSGKSSAIQNNQRHGSSGSDGSIQTVQRNQANVGLSRQ